MNNNDNETEYQQLEHAFNSAQLHGKPCDYIILRMIECLQQEKQPVKIAAVK